MVETCTWKQRSAVWIPNFRLYKFWGEPVEGGGGSLSPSHANHMNICLSLDNVRNFHNGANFKSTFSDKNTPKFLGAFPGFLFFSYSTAYAGSQNSAYCTKQWWHLFSKDTNNPWIEVVREDLPAFLKKPPQQQWILPIFPSFLDFSFLLLFVNNSPHWGVMWMPKWRSL